MGSNEWKISAKLAFLVDAMGHGVAAVPFVTKTNRSTHGAEDDRSPNPTEESPSGEMSVERPGSGDIVDGSPIDPALPPGEAPDA